MAADLTFPFKMTKKAPSGELSPAKATSCLYVDDEKNKLKLALAHIITKIKQFPILKLN